MSHAGGGLRGFGRRRGRCAAVLWLPLIVLVTAFFAAPMVHTRTASALEVELLDVAPDRVERQRVFVRGDGPLPNTPDTRRLPERLAERGLAAGNPIFVRIFKQESQLELWMQKGDAFVLLDTYPICHWTGTLGPKLREGDKQSPEGFYSIAAPQLRHLGRWRRGLNIGFPNAYDQIQQRTGSYILIHGGCSSTGCFAMTGPVQDEIYHLAEAAIRNGQPRVHIHVFPFRMTDANMQAQSASIWRDFWDDLRAAYDSFDRTRVPPSVEVCNRRYAVADGRPGETGDPRPLAIARPSRLAATDDRPVSSACVMRSIPPPAQRVADLQPPTTYDRDEASAVMSDAPLTSDKVVKPSITGALRSSIVRRQPRRLPQLSRRAQPVPAERAVTRIERRRAMQRRVSRSQKRSPASDWMKPYIAAAERARQFSP